VASSGEKLFAPEGSAEGCASGECLPAAAPPAVAVAVALKPLAAAPPELVVDDEPESEAPPTPRPTSDHAAWERAVDGVREASVRHGKSLSVARFLGFTPEGVRVAFPADAAFHRSQVIGMSRNVVEEALSKALGRPIKLIEDTNPQAFEQAQKSIAEVEANDRQTRERAIDRKVREHPAVRAVMRHLGGGIEHISILEPVARERPAAGPSTDEPPADE
jgi:hypothetical protein